MSNAAFSPAAERNKQPILDVLRQVLPKQGCALEVASGTGQHTAWFATALPQWVWQPTEADADALPGLAARMLEAGLNNVHPPLLLDVLEPQWPTIGATAFDTIYCANMLHISPWATCAALMQGTARHLTPKGTLVLYGPFLEDDIPTSLGNLAFDESLRSQNEAWGLRQKADVAHEAQRAGLVLRERHAMPANNLILVFARAA